MADRYEFNDGKSSKFWEIELSGSAYTVRYGRIGTNGQTKTKVFDSAAEAVAAADKVTKSKVKKGYAPVAAVPKSGGTPSNAELEAALIANPHDTAAWEVYGDWLQTQGSPRGALVAAQLAGDSGDNLIEAHKAEFLGRFGTDWEDGFEVEWRNGFWRSGRVFLSWDNEDMDFLPALEAMLSHDSARFLEVVRIGLCDLEGEVVYDESIGVLVAAGERPSVRHLHLGDFEYPDDTEISWTDVGDCTSLFGLYPNLRHLHLQGGSIQLSPVTHASLEKLQLHTGGLLGPTAVAIGRSSFPALTHLEVWFGTDNYGGTTKVSDIDVILQSKGLGAVKWLGLMNYDGADKLVKALPGAPILPQLEVLDLSMGTLTAAGAQVILDNAAAFAHLKVLNLKDNFISDELVAKLQAALPQAQLGDQEDADDWIYVSVGE